MACEQADRWLANCTAPLTEAILRKHALEIKRGLHRAANNCGATNIPSHLTGLRGLQSVVTRSRFQPPETVIRFESDGVSRELRYVVSRVQDVDWQEALQRFDRGVAPISTFVGVGVSKMQTQHSMDILCNASLPMVAPDLRVIESGSYAVRCRGYVPSRAPAQAPIPSRLMTCLGGHSTLPLRPRLGCHARAAVGDMRL